MTQKDQQYLSAWQIELSKSYLQLLVLALLAGSPKRVAELSHELPSITGSTLMPRDASLYRVMRRLEVAGVVEYNLQPGNAGPAYKQFHLTSKGREMLKVFIKRNQSLLLGPKVKDLLRQVAG